MSADKNDKNDKKLKKTNAARLLDLMGVDYSLIEYEVDENDLSAEHVASSCGMPLGQIFKTLVARGDKSGVIVAVISGEDELNLKRLASASGNKHVELVALKEVQPLTGYLRGGCSPVAQKKKYPTYIDEKARNFDKITVSAGVRGMQLFLSPADLASACSGVFASIV